MHNYTYVQIYVNKYVNQNVSQGCEGGQVVGGVALGQGGPQQLHQKAVLSSSPPSWTADISLPPFSVIPHWTLSEGWRGLQRLIGEAQKAFSLLIGQWVAEFQFSPGCIWDWCPLRLRKKDCLKDILYALRFNYIGVPKHILQGPNAEPWKGAWHDKRSYNGILKL